MIEKTKIETLAKTQWTKVFALRKFISLAKVQSSQAPASLVVGGIYQVGKKIANGAFGQLRLGRNLRTNENIAIKLEHVNAKIPMLLLEFRFYRSMGSYAGLPKVYYYGTCGKYNALVMELLGSNLEELFVKCRRHFSLKTILLIAIQLLHHIEYIHSYGIIYRDIKPENCVVGRRACGRSDTLYVVDFGLAKEYIDPDTGRHIPYTENKSLTGTVRYMSINSHQGKEQSRRDDLEALGHVFFYFLSGGVLPWQGVKCEDIRKRYQIIGHIKEETSINELGLNYPWEFSVYLRYCRNLKFNQQPDYAYLRGLFRSCLTRMGWTEDKVFDWMDLKTSSSWCANLDGANNSGGFNSPRSRYSAQGQTLNYEHKLASRSNESIVLSTRNAKSNKSEMQTMVQKLSNRDVKSEDDVEVTQSRPKKNSPVVKAVLPHQTLSMDDQESVENALTKALRNKPKSGQTLAGFKFETPLIIIHASDNDDTLDLSESKSNTLSSYTSRALQNDVSSVSKPVEPPRIRPIAKIEPIKKPENDEIPRIKMLSEQDFLDSHNQWATQNGKGSKICAKSKGSSKVSSPVESVKFDSCCSFFQFSKICTR